MSFLTINNRGPKEALSEAERLPPGTFFWGKHKFRVPHPHTELMWVYPGGIAFLERGTWVEEKASVEVVRIIQNLEITTY